LEENAGLSNIQGEERSWTALWNIKIPSKLKVFLWRLARDSLPTADLLHHRHMAQQSSCAICGDEDSWRHSLVNCNMARCVWALAPPDIIDLVGNIREPHARGWLAAVFEALPHEERTRVVVTLWAIWHAKRKAVYEGMFQSPLLTNAFVERFLNDLNLLAASPAKETKQTIHCPKWIPPPAGMVKVNVDAALSKNSSMGSIADVVRRGDSTFMGASSVVLAGITEPETLEALACREGTAVAADLLLQRFRLASDCANVVRCLREEGMGRYGHIVQEIKARAVKFQQVDFVHESRRANVDAHGLARSSLSLPLGRHVWFLAPPDGVCMMQLPIE
jgi:hypothetical protein